MLEVKDGKIYVEGVETIDPELIGFAFLDIVERSDMSIILSDSSDKDLFIDMDCNQIKIDIKE